ncbi:zinc finger protein OZF-like [Metopolophium dirhodum]|uniref:zinc finger protein OZF-like n=1 Tax=Metopolophium dirhodum TaxID=44670 RepID=UPI0029904C6D|nr:zinc finger protein OZF-like [Metopolophium dirhodum]
MFSFIMQIFLTMVFQLALLVRLINGKYCLNDGRKFVNKYKPHYHDEVLVELLYDVDDLLLPNPNHESSEMAVLRKENFSNFPFPSVGINGLVRHGYVFYKEEDEKIYDTKFMEASKMADDIFSEENFSCYISKVTKRFWIHFHRSEVDVVGDAVLTEIVDQIKSNNYTRTHTGKKPYACNSCDKAFSYKESLKTHSRKHTGEKPFKCKSCGKSFSDQSNLNGHTRTHTGEKPFVCHTCGRAFSRKSSIVTHLRIHSGEKPNKCKSCSRTFADRSNLTKHIRTHTGEKPHACNSCNKAFSRKTHLMTHLSTHTG